MEHPSRHLGRGTRIAVALARLLGLLLLAGIAPERGFGQNCGCPPDLCCSQFGYCGSSADYCGSGCKQGPCSSSATAAGGSTSVNVAEVVSDAFFDGIIAQAGGGCPGKAFYTRSAFLKAVASYQGFAGAATADDSKREIAAFFAHVTQQTGHFCYIEEVAGAARNYCDRSNKKYRCAAGKSYYGRGPLQLSWSYNYGAAGQSIGIDLLGSPETVAQDPVVSFKTALWFWMTSVHPVIRQGFGATVRAVVGGDCGGGNSSGAASALVRYYTDYCNKLSVPPGSNLNGCGAEPIRRFRVGLFILST